jgi:nitrate reductase NapD
MRWTFQGQTIILVFLPDFLTGDIEDIIVESMEVHISSMVVLASPAGLQSVKDKIETLHGAEIHAESDSGKLVVVLESDSQTNITDVIETINNFKHVLSTSLVYHQIEPLDTLGNDQL